MKYEAHYNLAILLKSMKKYADSIEEFKKAGLILDTKGNSNKTRYIYDVLNEVNQKYAVSEEYENLRERLDEEEKAGKKEVTYVKGKMLVVDEFDGAMIKNFKTCANKQYFETGIRD